jgi:hypothetical protein
MKWITSSPPVVAFVAFVALSALGGCHKTKQYESDVKISRMSVVRKDEQGKPITMDVEIAYFPCPGEQYEVMRGNAEFSACVLGKSKVGDTVKAKILHRWDPAGHYRSDVVELAGCKRELDPEDEASFQTVRDCEDWSVNGAKVGFRCNLASKKNLNKVCPWFQRR